MEGHPGEPGASIAPRVVRTPLARDPAASPRRWAVLALLRPHQWAKNFLVFLPLLLSHQVRDVHRWAGVLTAFVAFCLAASSVYVFNDWRDVEQDRRHPTKRGRPLASGRLPLAYGPPLAAALLGAAVLVSVLLLPLQFTVILVIYLAASTAYTAYFKSRLLVDVMVLAGLYTLRVLAGGAAGQAPVSNWMQAFSVFLFVSLAFAKRYTELTAIEGRGETHAGGRGYEVRDLRVIESVGPASGYMAVLVSGPVHQRSDDHAALPVAGIALAAVPGADVLDHPHLVLRPPPSPPRGSDPVRPAGPRQLGLPGGRDRDRGPRLDPLAGR